MNLVNLKGTNSGIVLELSSEPAFDELKTEIARKFKESRNFLGKASMGIFIKGRAINDVEENEIVDIIRANSDIDISCILRENSELDQIFVHYAKHNDDLEKESDKKETNIENDHDDADVKGDIIDSLDGIAKIYPGSLRSGQSISDNRSVVILGDVKPGASVTSEGSIFVMGALRGSAFAGSGGDERAFVVALELDPLQVRIANAIAISPDSETGPKLKMRRFRKKVDEKTTEVAFILNGHVVKDAYGASFLKNHLGAK